jgi:hypothetical protein
MTLIGLVSEIIFLRNCADSEADDADAVKLEILPGERFPDAQVVRKPGRYEDIGRRITNEEFREAEQEAIEAGLYRFDVRWRDMRKVF